MASHLSLSHFASVVLLRLAFGECVSRGRIAISKLYPVLCACLCACVCYGARISATIVLNFWSWVQARRICLLWVQMCIFLSIFQFGCGSVSFQRVNDFKIDLSCSHHQLLLLPLILFCCCYYQFKLFFTFITIVFVCSLSPGWLSFLCCVLFNELDFCRGRTGLNRMADIIPMETFFSAFLCEREKMFS